MNPCKRVRLAAMCVMHGSPITWGVLVGWRLGSTRLVKSKVTGAIYLLIDNGHPCSKIESLSNEDGDCHPAVELLKMSFDALDLGNAIGVHMPKIESFGLEDDITDAINKSTTPAAALEALAVV